MVLTTLYETNRLNQKQIQPISETIEIVFWLAQIIICLCFYPAKTIALTIG